ncbi:peptidoglycan DD-metalloendopeptidase family protein [Funiculus sociatus GB2-A5]|uniref:Peptidoglycan DD-metalloendopeptidase family protein n=1 Tax=Funiculus sociatus GB2-A5 TaxID=2933946 RepID=A0ABV0JNM3_9CYAN|nr:MULTISPECIES: M23 family metallopeptidase [unclassified Trichocoleus]
MQERNHPSCTLFGLFCRRKVLMQGLSWIGGIGVISSGWVVAQTDPSIDNIGSSTTQEAPPVVRFESNSPRPPAPPAARRRSIAQPERAFVPRRRSAPTASEPSVVRRRSTPTASEPSVVRRRSTPKPVASRRRRSTPKPIASRRRYSPELEQASAAFRRRYSPAAEPTVARRRRSAPAVESTAVSREPELSAPNLLEPNAISYVKPPKLAPSKPGETEIASSDYNNNYIDPTDYSLGATSGGEEPSGSYEEPPEVVLSERSTGCQSVLQSGEGVSGGLCGSGRVASRRRDRVTANLASSPRSRRTYGNEVRQAIRARESGNRAEVTEAIRAVGYSNRSGLRRSRLASRLERNSRRGTLLASAGPVQIGPIRDRSNRTRYRRDRTSSSAPAIASNFQSEREYTPQNVPSYKPLIPTIFRGLSNGNTSLIFPLAVPAPITSLFGWRVHPISGSRRFHAGTDLGAPMGTPVLAAYAGRVAIADWMGGYGQAIVLQHNETQETLYAHLSEILVQPGQVIEQGTVIGRVGSTGNSTGPHLHFEVRQLTESGWMAMNSGAQLEYGLAQLIKALQVAQAPPQTTPQTTPQTIPQTIPQTTPQTIPQTMQPDS